VLHALCQSLIAALLHRHQQTARHTDQPNEISVYL
jgi:hypothetical protein